jgi:hypothetical protein
MPMIEQVFVHRFVVYRDVVRELGRIVVQKVTERFDDLSDNGCEIGIVFRQFLRESDEGIEGPRLLSREYKGR